MKILGRLIDIAVVLICLVALAGILAPSHPNRVQAQSTNPLNITVTGPHTSCMAAASGVTTYCFATDGLYESLNGAAYVQLGVAAAGVNSITVCNAAGASCGTAQTGAVSLNIPTKAVTTATAPSATSTVTVSAPSATTTLQ